MISLYCGDGIIGENIFAVLPNYARKKDVALELLRYPFQDDELWAFTFVKKGTIFVCINTDLPLNKQVFAAAHEFYHIHCYIEDEDPRIIQEGSLLDSHTADEAAQSKEDIEANAFAALLLMPDRPLNDQIQFNEIEKSRIILDDILSLMDFFGVPYKAVVLRLYESQIINKSKATELLSVPSELIQKRIALSGKAKRWILSGHGLETFSSLLDNFDYNQHNDLLTCSRLADDLAYIDKLQKQFGIQ